VEDAASPAGYLVITCSSERDADRERSYVRLLRSMRAAVVLFAGSGLADPELEAELDRHVAAMRAEGAAVVHLSPHAGGEPEVGVDNVAGIATMIAALAGLGHRRIAFLAGPVSLHVARARLAGYRRGLEAAGIEEDATLEIATGFDREGGERAVDELLASGTEVTAIACGNDLLALGAMARLQERGVRVPEDISVAGFDDISVAAITAPSLSTVRLPLRDLGRRGFELAAQMLEGAEPEPETLPTTLVLRGSTAPPRAATPLTPRATAVATGGPR
jgi:LacI family transcriptional regulator